METTPLILQLASTSCSADESTGLSGLAEIGLPIIPCADMRAFTQQAEAARQAGHSPLIAVLDARDPKHYGATAAVRALYPAAGIVIRADLKDESALLGHLHGGADAYCGVTASPKLLAAVVLRLISRLTGNPVVGAGLQDPGTVASPPAWELVNQGWALCTPSGMQVGLTTTERAFLVALLEAPGQQATHQQLLHAINAPSEDSGRKNQTNLGVMVSRMRRKFVQAGAPLPLQSIHNWGYMFAPEDTQTQAAPPPSGRCAQPTASYA